jgi:hypothetical protein
VNLTQQDVMALMVKRRFGRTGLRVFHPMVFNGMLMIHPEQVDSVRRDAIGGCRQAGAAWDFPLMQPGLVERPACPQLRRRYARMIWRQIPAPLLNALIELLQRRSSPDPRDTGTTTCACSGSQTRNTLCIRFYNLDILLLVQGNGMNKWQNHHGNRR